MYQRDIAVVAPNPLVRAGLAALLERFSHSVTDEAPDVARLLQCRPSRPPGLIILLVETLQDATPGTDLCRREWPETRIVILYDRCGLHDAHTLSYHANALLPTCISQETLLHALDLLAQEEDDILFLLAARSTLPNTGRSDVAREAALDAPKGNAWGNRRNGQDGNGHSKLRAISAETMRSNPGIIPKLSQREIAILDGLVLGLRNKEIARTCGIAEPTVKIHMKSILRKLQVANRTQAAVWALENSEAIAQLESRLFGTAASSLPAFRLRRRRAG